MFGIELLELCNLGLLAYISCETGPVLLCGFTVSLGENHECVLKSMALSKQQHGEAECGNLINISQTTQQAR